MTLRGRFAAALLLALPIEAGNLLLVGIVLDPGPPLPGLFPKFLTAEWVFFHFWWFRMIDTVHQVLGTERAALIFAFFLAYAQTALFILLLISVASRLRRQGFWGGRQREHISPDKSQYGK